MSSVISFIQHTNPIQLLLLATMVITGSYALVRSRRAPLPPGPKPWPFVGNIPHMPKIAKWETYREWAKKYGPIMTLSLGILGPRMVIINSLDAARVIMGTRSANYADRPPSTVSELKGSNWTITSLSGEPHRVRRALAQRYYSGSAAKSHRHLQVRETHDLLRGISTSPNSLSDHLKRFAANVVLLSTYGYRVEDSSDPVLTRIEEALTLESKSIGIIGTLLDAFPILQYYPTWLPFSGFKKRLAVIKSLVITYLRDEPYAKSKAYIAEGKASPCFISTLLEDLSPDQEQENLIRDCAGVMYGAGVDSTVASMRTFFLAAVLYPSFLKKAQAEVDSVTGGERLPTFDDCARMPFVEAIVLEVLRWNVVTPFGFPHRSANDDIYDGMLIPGGSSVMVNEWMIFRDPSVFPDPERFDPSRFVGEGSEKRREIVTIGWGWGRRVCPGRQLAEASLLIAIASVAAVFDVGHATDADGKDIPVEANFSSGFVRRPTPFKCSVVPRSIQALELIESNSGSGY